MITLTKNLKRKPFTKQSRSNILPVRNSIAIAIFAVALTVSNFTTGRACSQCAAGFLPFT